MRKSSQRACGEGPGGLGSSPGSAHDLLGDLGRALPHSELPVPPGILEKMPVGSLWYSSNMLL